MFNTDMNLIVQAAFYEHLQEAANQRERRQHSPTRSRASFNMRGRVGSVLVALGQRLQALDGARAEQIA